MADREVNDSHSSRVVSDGSVFGFGLHSYGMESTKDHGVILTRWLTVLFVPLIPLKRLKCEYCGRSGYMGVWAQVLWMTFDYRVKSRLPLSFYSVVRTWLWSAAGLIVAIGPLAAVMLLTANRAANKIEAVFAISSIFWMCGFVFCLESCQRRFLETTWSPERLQMEANSKATTRDTNRNYWLNRHVLPEWSAAAFGVGGMLLGVLIGVKIGLPVGGKAILIPIIGSGAVAMLTWLLCDWLLVKRRRSRFEVNQSFTTKDERH